MNAVDAIRKALPLLKRSDEECEGGDWCCVHDDHMAAGERCFTGHACDLLREQIQPIPSGSVVGAARALLDELGDDRCLLGFVPQASGKYCSPHGKFGVTHARCSTGQAIDALRAALNSSAPQVVPLPGECPAVSAAGEALAPELTADGGSGAGGAHEFHSEPWTAPGYASKCSCGWDALPGHRFSIVDAKALHREHLASLAP